MPSIRFRILNGRIPVEPGLLAIQLHESRSFVRDVSVSRTGIRWREEEGGQAGRTTAQIVLEVVRRVPASREFFATVEYAGGPPIVSGIDYAASPDAPAPKPAGDPATRIARRRAAAKRIRKRKTKARYLWFTLLEERSDEDVLHSRPPPDPTVDVPAAVTELRSALQALLRQRMVSAHASDEDADVCTPVVDGIAEHVLVIRERIFDGGMVSAGALKHLGAKVASGTVDTFLAFCQGDLRVTDALSDVNVEPDSAMVFLFAEYALVLLQVVDEVLAPTVPIPMPIDPRLEKLARAIAADPLELELWKRLAAAFVLGQRAYLRAYAPRRSLRPARFEDYALTNFDRSEKMTDAELDQLRGPYEALTFDNARPSRDDAALKQLAWRHALNACEAFPGNLEIDRSGKVDKLTLPAAKQLPPTVTVHLRAVRGSSAAVRRDLRRVVASLAPGSEAIAMGATMSKLGIGPATRRRLQAVLVTFIESRTGRAVPKRKLPIDASTTVEDLALRVDELLD